MYKLSAYIAYSAENIYLYFLFLIDYLLVMEKKNIYFRRCSANIPIICNQCIQPTKRRLLYVMLYSPLW